MKFKHFRQSLDWLGSVETNHGCSCSCCQVGDFCPASDRPPWQSSQWTEEPFARSFFKDKQRSWRRRSEQLLAKGDPEKYISRISRRTTAAAKTRAICFFCWWYCSGRQQCYGKSISSYPSANLIFNNFTGKNGICQTQGTKEEANF